MECSFVSICQEVAVDDQERNRLLRKYKDKLYISGTGIMVLAVWAVLQFCIYMTMMRREIEDIAKEVPDLGVEVVYIILVAEVLLEVALRLYIGICARSVVMTGKRRITYIFVTGLVILIYVLVLGLTILTFSSYSIVQFIVTILVQLTAIVINVQLIQAGIKVRRLSV